ncbi:MAG: hypothetical protein ACREBG_18915 [Pyrinomonadaceae bacterium]
MSQNHPREYPNVKARLRLSRKGPGLPARENYMDIWMKGTRFRVRDESGRDVASILGDLSARNGLGASPRSIEEIMDVWSQSRDAQEVVPGATELYGDLATNEGWVHRRGQTPWPIRAEELAPAAEQILDQESNAQLEPRGQLSCLGRLCTEYDGFLEGEDQGIPYKTAVTRVVSPPYLLSSIVRDAQNANHYYTREIVALEEGVATDTDLSPS